MFHRGEGSHWNYHLHPLPLLLLVLFFLLLSLVGIEVYLIITVIATLLYVDQNTLGSLHVTANCKIATKFVRRELVEVLTVSNHEPQSSWWLQVPIRELPFRNHFQNFPMLFRTRKYWSSRKYQKCYDCIHLTLLSSSSYSIYYYTLKLSSRIIITILYKRTFAHSIYTFTLVTNTSVVFAHLRQRPR